LVWTIRLIENKKILYFVLGREILYTGPIIVACQWNTFKKKSLCKLFFFYNFDDYNLQSSKTGPAAQFAGGSFSKFCNSFIRRRRRKKE
jgi:hypothetical protein